MPQTLALLEEIKWANKSQAEQLGERKMSETLARMPNVKTVRGNGKQAPFRITRTGSKLVKLMNKKTGQRIV